MIAAGRFPFPGGEADLVTSPRVGDGLLRLDRAGTVQYASPNALSAYRRLGLTARPGRRRTWAARPPSWRHRRADRRGPVGGGERAAAQGDGGGGQRRGGAAAGDPAQPRRGRIGALVLVRDVTELRRRERELMTKDATIREIHHRVKNNLQTVAALLRLQARRLRHAARAGRRWRRRCAGSARSRSCTRRCRTRPTSSSTSTTSPTG